MVWPIAAEPGGAFHPESHGHRSPGSGGGLENALRAFMILLRFAMSGRVLRTESSL